MRAITSNKNRQVLMSALFGLSLIYTGFVFWQQDAEFSRPTPRPAGLYQPPIGSQTRLSPTVAALWHQHKNTLLFLHFYNPYCACSRFNLDHVRALFEANREKVTFVALIQSHPTPKMLADITERLDGMPIESDKDRVVAESLGVYSTPQAVIIDTHGKLRFRGNYNSTRYCTDARSEYARLALEALLAGTDPIRTEMAETAYGCPLTKKSNSLLPEVFNP